MATHTRIYGLMLVLLGERWLEVHTALAPLPHAIVAIALIVGIYSVVVAWIGVERRATDRAREVQPVPPHPRTNSKRAWHVRMPRIVNGNTSNR